MSSISNMFYKQFWYECGSKGLTIQQKVDALCKLRDLSLKVPYWLLKENDVIKEGKKLDQLFSELIPSTLCNKHRHLSTLTGQLLYTIQMELFEEIKKYAKEGKLTEQQLNDIQTF